jgi:hypothetical protein
MGFAHYGGKLPPWSCIFSTTYFIIITLKYVSKFIMVKATNSLTNENQLLYREVNSLIINGIHQ